jgi:hypothetical protein
MSFPQRRLNPSISPTDSPDDPPFSYPFRKPDEKEFTDEHEFHKLLADESTGFFPISDSGMWHGGIHVSADGAGKQLDLKYGVRCIAKGEVVAYLHCSR